MGNILIGILGIGVVILVGAICYLFGLFAGIHLNFEESDTENLYCFECEIETPVKEKNRNMYCSNCGLHH